MEIVESKLSQRFSNFSEKFSFASTYKSTILTSNDQLDTAVTIPPDGGWGWIIVMASFLVNLLVDGAIYTFGIFLDEISQSFEVDMTQVAVASSLMTGFYFISGPVACAIINRFGFQITGILGGILSATAYFVSSWMNSITPFIVILGLIAGLGFGLSYVPSIVVVGFYFSRWRSLATSMAATGSACGILVYPLIVKFLLTGYSWRTQFQIIGGGCLITSFLALTYRPLKPITVQAKSEKRAIQFFSESLQTLQNMTSVQMPKKPGFFTRLFGRFHNVTYPTAAQLHKDSTVIIDLKPTATSSSMVLFTSGLESNPSSSLHLDPSRTESFVPSRLDPITSRLDRLSTVYETEAAKPGKCKKCCRNCFHWGRNIRPMYRDDIFYTGPSLVSAYTAHTISSVRVASRMSQSQLETNKIKSAVEYHLSVTRAGIRGRDTEKLHCKCCPESVVRTLVTMLNITLLQSPSFLLLALSGTLTILGMYAPFIYLIQKAAQCGIDNETAYHLYTVLGVTNAVGRIVSGMIATIPQAKPLMVSYVSILICGVATTTFYFVCSVIGHFILISVFGLTIACVATLRAPILVELLGLEALTNAFGILLLFQSVAAFTGVPVAGAVVHVTNNNYSVAFLFAGCAIIFSAILLMPIKEISEWEKKKNRAF